MSKPQKIELISAIGFGGRVPNGLISHPDGVHLIYPLGSTVVIKNTKTNKQVFLHGHTDTVTCIAVSHSGKVLASGQKTHMGFKANIMLWDFEAALLDSGENNSLIRKLPELHEVKIQAMSFSAKDSFLATIGGTDDNTLVIWNVKTGKAMTGTQAANESALCVQFYNSREDMLVTGGYQHLRRWHFNAEKCELTPTQVNLGTLRRIFKSFSLSEDDTCGYAGTTSGDLLLIQLQPQTPAFSRASNEMFSKGIRSVCWVKGRKKNTVLLGNGDGSIVVLDAKTLKKINQTKIMGSVTSVTPVRSSISDVVTELYCGTSESNIYYCSNIASISTSTQLRASCHYEGINDCAFLSGFDAVFVTCSKNDLRVWNAKKQQELLRIQVPNVDCTCVALPSTGDLIITGWDDGKIRAFRPVSGELDYVINNAHPMGVTAVAVTNDCQRIVSGGKAGQVRFWCTRTKKMIASLKEHKAPVQSVVVRSDDKKCLSSSDDGSCIHWDLQRATRSQAMFASTMFKRILYHPDESQFLTCGSDRKLTYWDAYDGSAIRIIDGSNYEINALDIDPAGVKFVSGGNDCTVKVFDYDEGEVNALGKGHSGAIRCIKISPDQKQIVSVGEEGAIFVWKYPYPKKGGCDEIEAKQSTSVVEEKKQTD